VWGTPFGGEQGLARSQPEFLVADSEAELPLEDVEELVLGVVDVQRRRVAARREVLEQAGPVAAFVAAHADVTSVFSGTRSRSGSSASAT
jgi:hypothetical protein